MRRHVVSGEIDGQVMLYKLIAIRDIYYRPSAGWYETLVSIIVDDRSRFGRVISKSRGSQVTIIA